jgi:cytochrome c peroxidase
LNPDRRPTAIAQAIAAYERTMEPGIAAFDRWVEGDEGAITEPAKRGFVLLNTRTTCFSRHTGWRFTDSPGYPSELARRDDWSGACAGATIWLMFIVYAGVQGLG